LRLECFDKTQTQESKGKLNNSSQKVSTFNCKGRRSYQCKGSVLTEPTRQEELLSLP